MLDIIPEIERRYGEPGAPCPIVENSVPDWTRNCGDSGLFADAQVFPKIAFVVIEPGSFDGRMQRAQKKHVSYLKRRKKRQRDNIKAMEIAREKLGLELAPRPRGLVRSRHEETLASQHTYRLVASLWLRQLAEVWREPAEVWPDERNMGTSKEWVAKRYFWYALSKDSNDQDAEDFAAEGWLSYLMSVIRKWGDFHILNMARSHGRLNTLQITIERDWLDRQRKWNTLKRKIELVSLHQTSETETENIGIQQGRNWVRRQAQDKAKAQEKAETYTRGQLIDKIVVKPFFEANPKLRKLEMGVRSLICKGVIERFDYGVRLQRDARPYVENRKWHPDHYLVEEIRSHEKGRDGKPVQDYTVREWLRTDSKSLLELADEIARFVEKQ